MDRKPQKILVNGYGWTGSTALVQMFSEYAEVSVIPNEFDDFRVPGAIGDVMDWKLREQEIHSNPSRRFDCMKSYLFPFFIRGLVPDGLWPKLARGGATTRKEALMIAVNYIREFFLYKKCITGISAAASKQEVFEIASGWIEKIVGLYSHKSRHVVFDQPILFDCHTDYWPKVFDGSKLILLARNPLDQMGSILKDGSQLLEAPNWYVGFLYGRDSHVNRPLEFFMQTTLERYKFIMDTYEKIGPENMLVVQFENLVKNYEVTKSQIEHFSGIDCQQHVLPLKHFKPDESEARLNARGVLCEVTRIKAQEMEKDYLKMIEYTNAI